MIEQIGPVYLNGLTVAEANDRLRKAFATKYAGVAEDETDVSLTLGQIRSILVNVMGEVNIPGSYRLSPFSTVFNAIYRAGGINDIGTLRNIHVIRNGSRLLDVDIYDYLFGGHANSASVRLQEGDVIIVPPTKILSAWREASNARCSMRSARASRSRSCSDIREASPATHSANW